MDHKIKRSIYDFIEKMARRHPEWLIRDKEDNTKDRKVKMSCNGSNGVLELNY